jgi:D-alanyl-D-alanine carboxypeptidase
MVLPDRRRRRSAPRRVTSLVLLLAVFIVAAASATRLLDGSAVAPPSSSRDPSAAPSVAVVDGASETDPPPAAARRDDPRDEAAALRERRLAAATDRRHDRLQARLDRLRDKYDIPGISVTIIFPDGGIWIGTSGMADIGAEVPVTRDTAFAIASISKTFTAALVMALAEEGRLGLDDRVADHLPDLGLDQRISVRQLLDHTSGLHDYFFHPKIDRLLFARKSTAWDETDSLRYVGRPYFAPGRGWHYSNTNYLLLGLVAEAVGEAPIDALLRERFVEPLRLTRTWYQGAEEPRGPVAHGYRIASAGGKATPVDLSDGSDVVPFTSVVTAAAGAGSVAATSTDVARWVRALYGGNVISTDAVREMIDGALVTGAYRPRVPYGLGVQLVDLDGHRALGHSGRFTGFRSVVRWLPDERVAIAVLTNQSRIDPAIIAKALVRIALEDQAGCAACALPR